MHPHLYELDHVNVVIHQNHRAALQDAHLSVLQGKHVSRIAAVAMVLRAAAAILLPLGGRIRNQPVASSEPIATLEVAGEPADGVAVA